MLLQSVPDSFPRSFKNGSDLVCCSKSPSNICLHLCIRYVVFLYWAVQLLLVSVIAISLQILASDNLDVTMVGVPDCCKLYLRTALRNPQRLLRIARIKHQAWRHLVNQIKTRNKLKHTHTHGQYFRTNWVSRYQSSNTFLDFAAATDDGGGDGKSELYYRSSPLPEYQHSRFYRPDAFHVAQSSVSKHRRHQLRQTEIICLPTSDQELLTAVCWCCFNCVCSGRRSSPVSLLCLRSHAMSTAAAAQQMESSSRRKRRRRRGLLLLIHREVQ